MVQPIGYLLGIVGVVGIAIGSIPQIQALLKIPLALAGVRSDYVIIGISLLILLLGVLMISKGGSSGKQPAEVPIYQGKNIVGYRRMGK